MKLPDDRLPERLYSAASVREMDRASIQDHNLPGYLLMTRAAEACVQALYQHWPQPARAAIICGGGNNGGDGYVLARLLIERGVAVEALWLLPPERLKGDAAMALRDAVAADVPVRPFSTERLARCDLIVDALLGTGLERPVEGEFLSAIRAINAARAAGAGVLAIDLPSGLAADTGCVLGEAAVIADATVSFIGLKAGLVTGAGPAHAGTLHFADLGAPAAVIAAAPVKALRYSAADRGALLGPRARTAHKGDFGHVLVIGGDAGMGGAVKLCSEAALRSGAGLVSCATHPGHASHLLSGRPEIMFRSVGSAEALTSMLGRASVLAVGPGLGRSEWGRGLWKAALATALPLVLDADGLNLLADAPSRRDHWVLTPHPAEAARLLGCSTAEVQSNRFASAEALAERFGGVAVLKGAGSVIASARPEDGVPVVIAAGNPGMASGGMGDVLTGIIAALLAQGLTAFDAARLGAWLHAKAADLAVQAGGERGLIAGDLFIPLRRLVNP